jgi:hypothetical protein
MASPNKTTTDDAHSSQAAAQQKPGSGITDKFGYGFTTVPTYMSLILPHPAA